MKGLFIHERVILESLSKTPLDFEALQRKTGLQEDMSFRIIQGLIIKGLIQNENGQLRLSHKIPEEQLEELNGPEARKLESFEFIEKIIQKNSRDHFQLQRYALSKSEEKILRAMIYNLESFLKECHQKNHKTIQVKDHTLFFWGLESVDFLLKGGSV